MGTEQKKRRPGLSGKGLWASHLMWCELLRQWCDGQDKDHLDVICFDKLCLFSGLVWNHLAGMGEVGWRVPYVAAPGIHGHGPMLQVDPEKRDSPFVVQFLIREFLELPILARDVFTLDPEPTGPDSRVRDLKAAMKRSTFDSFVDDAGTLTERERDLIDGLGGAIGKLTDQEIRVLGVHSGLSRTIEAIEFNVSFCCRLLLDPHWLMNVHHPKRAEVLRTFKQLVKELLRKTGQTKNGGENHLELYKKARPEVLKYCDVPLRSAIEEVCPLPGAIWGTPEVGQWKKKTLELADMADYLDGLVAWTDVQQRLGGSPNANEGARISRGSAVISSLAATGHKLYSYDELTSEKGIGVKAQIEKMLNAFVGGLPPVAFPDHWGWRTGH